MDMLYLFYVMLVPFIKVTALPEGKWDANLTKVYSWNYSIAFIDKLIFQDGNNEITLYKSLYKGAKVYVSSR